MEIAGTLKKRDNVNLKADLNEEMEKMFIRFTYDTNFQQLSGDQKLSFMKSD